MPRKVTVPGPASQAIGPLEISRELKIRVLASIHDDLPISASKFQKFRLTDDERVFFYRVLLDEGSARHFFVFAVDDTTSPDHFILMGLGRRKHDEPSA